MMMLRKKRTLPKAENSQPLLESLLQIHKPISGFFIDFFSIILYTFYLHRCLLLPITSQ